MRHETVLRCHRCGSERPIKAVLTRCCGRLDYATIVRTAHWPFALTPDDEVFLCCQRIART